MNQDWSAPGWAVLAAIAIVVLLVVGGLVVVVAAVVGQRRSRVRVEVVLASLSAVRADSEGLRAQVEAIERQLAPPAVRTDATEYKITMLGDTSPEDRGPGDTPVVGAPLFADLVLRESVVQAASLAAGLRRALAPATRNRIRFEMRREIKRARKQRRVDARLARQEYEARTRSSPSAAERAEGNAA